MTLDTTTPRQPHRLTALRRCARRVSRLVQTDTDALQAIADSAIDVGRSITAIKARISRISTTRASVERQRDMLTLKRVSVTDRVHVNALNAGITHCDEAIVRGGKLLDEAYVELDRQTRARADLKLLMAHTGMAPMRKPSAMRCRAPRHTHRNARAKVAVRTVRASRPTSGAAKKTTSSNGDPPPAEPDNSASLHSSVEVSS